MQWSSSASPVCFGPKELPYTTHLLLACLLELGKKFPGTLSPWGRWPTYSTKARYGSLSPQAVFHILVLYFRARFLELSSSHWRFFVWRSLYSTHSSLTMKSSIWQSYCPLNALIPKWVTLFHQTRRKSRRGFCKSIASEDHIYSIWWSSNGSLAYGLFPRPFFLKSLFFTDSMATTSSKFSISKLSEAGGHRRCRKYLRGPLR